MEDGADCFRVVDHADEAKSTLALCASHHVDAKGPSEEKRPLESWSGGVKLSVEDAIPMLDADNVVGDEFSRLGNGDRIGDSICRRWRFGR